MEAFHFSLYSLFFLRVQYDILLFGYLLPEYLRPPLKHLVSRSDPPTGFDPHIQHSQLLHLEQLRELVNEEDRVVADQLETRRFPPAKEDDLGRGERLVALIVEYAQKRTRRQKGEEVGQSLGVQEGVDTHTQFTQRRVRLEKLND